MTVAADEGAGNPPSDQDAEAARRLLEACAEEAETDIGNGRRMRRRCGDLAAEHYGAASHIAIAVANIGWHVFDGMRWKEDEDDARIRRLAHEAAIAIRDEIVVLGAYPKERERIEAGDIAKAALERMSEPDGGWSAEQKAERAALTAAAAEAARLRRAVADRKKSRARHAKSTAGSSKLSNMTTEMRPYVLRTVQELNTLRYSVNCRSGTIDFIQEEDEESDPDDPRFRWRAVLRPHRQDDMITKLAPVDWSEEGITQAPEFRRFLHKVQPDPEIRAFLKRFFGYCLTGLTIEQSMMFFHGAGRNGKSTFMDLICHVLDDYAVTLSIDSFSGEQKRGGGEATPDLARLPGARLVSASEPEAGVKLKDALIKLLTGGEKIPVRRLHKDFFEVDPQFKIVLSGNHKPRIDDDSDGIWRRVLLVPWDVQIPKDQVDRMLPAKLRREADAVFAWMVEGAIEYLNEGLSIPEAVRAASQEYREESDPIGTFIRVACVVTGETDASEKPLDLFMAYERFADAEGVFKFNRATFEKRFAKATGRSWEDGAGGMRQFQKAKSHGATVYRGIRIRAEWMRQGGEG